MVVRPAIYALMKARLAVSEATEGQQNVHDDEDGEIPNGPDTSSFKAFLLSFMSASSSSIDSTETIPEQNLDMEYPTLTPVGRGNKERKGLLSRGKHSIGKIINKAGRIGRFRQKPTHVIDSEIASQTWSVSSELDLKRSKESASNHKLPAMSEPSMLLSETMRNDLYPSLPLLVQGKNWMLVYSTWRHGISLSTLYRRSMLCAGDSLLIIGDKKGAVFGGLVEAPLRPIMQRKYQGTKNCFVFTNVAGHPVIYRSTGANNYFTFCSPEYLAIGGGGHFALYLDEDLLNGSSSTSETFNNPCLSVSQEFEVKHVELWGFVNASMYDEMLTVCRTEKPGIWNL
ncbi:uncharacterized protein [Lolium perenne]|uniref:uncharacterized protein n=1 Tax=Lolium perenne TaxID=4522 RepID=UPI0021F50C99|nr:uncharacterized protein LOC127316074 [Lolium perenne]